MKSWLIDFLLMASRRLDYSPSGWLENIWDKSTQHWELNWLNIESEIDSTLRVKLTQYWESNWLIIESQIGSALRVKLIHHCESNWLNIESQIDLTLRVKLTQHWESDWFNIESQIDSNILQLPTLPGWILVPPVTQLFRSKWLNLFSLWIVLAYTRFSWSKKNIILYHLEVYFL